MSKFDKIFILIECLTFKPSTVFLMRFLTKKKRSDNSIERTSRSFSAYIYSNSESEIQYHSFSLAKIQWDYKRVMKHNSLVMTLDLLIVSACMHTKNEIRLTPIKLCVYIRFHFMVFRCTCTHIYSKRSRLLKTHNYQLQLKELSCKMSTSHTRWRRWNQRNDLTITHFISSAACSLAHYFR